MVREAFIFHLLIDLIRKYILDEKKTARYAVFCRGGGI